MKQKLDLKKNSDENPDLPIDFKILMKTICLSKV